MTKFVVEGNDLDGAAVTRNVPVLVGGVDASGNVQTLSVGADGALGPGTSGTLYASGVAATPAKAFANVAASQTDSNLVTATAQKVIRVIALVVQCGGTATTVVFNTRTGAGAGSAISMTFQNAANGGVVLPRNDSGWFETAAGDILSVTTGAGSTTGIQLVYAKV